MDIQGLEWWTWMLIGLVLIGAELVIPGGLFLIFLGVAAVVVGALRALGMLPVAWVQLLVFAVLSVASLALFRRPLATRLRRGGADVRRLNGLVGEVAIAREAIPVDGQGKAELRGTTWTARNLGPYPIMLGERCTVADIDGLTLVVLGETARFGGLDDA